MRKIVVFNNVTLDGYFTGSDGDFSWAHRETEDAEWKAFVDANSEGDGLLLFGRVTYDMMASFWPTPMAFQRSPLLAEQMNARTKIVFSRTLEAATWNNTTLVSGDLVDKVRAMKAAEGPAMVVLGSGSIVSQLAQAGLVDEFQFVVNPVAIGKGRTLFEGVEGRLDMKLIQVRSFKNGKVVLTYAAGK